MAERVLTPYPIYTPGEKTVAPLTRLFLYAMADTARTTPLEVLDPITRAPLPGGFTTDAEGMTPYCILRGALLAQDDQTVQAVDDRDRLSTQRIPLDPARILSDDQATAMINDAVAPLATEESVASRLGTKLNASTYTAGMSTKADRQYVDDELAKKADSTATTTARGQGRRAGHSDGARGQGGHGALALARVTVGHGDRGATRSGRPAGGDCALSYGRWAGVGAAARRDG